jgi:tetratricopeptide (TPR) repeat protein
MSLIPNTERSYRNYGFFLLKQGRYKAAKEAFERAITIDSQDGWSYCGLGTALVLLDSFDDGIENISKGVKSIRDEYTYAALAFAYDKKGEYQKAIEEYKHSLLKNPNYLAANYNLGRDYVIMGWYDSAIQKFKEMLKLFPNFAECHNNLGSAYWHKGEVVNAEFEFKAAIFSNPKLAEAHYNLGVLYKIAGKYSKAADHFRSALSLVPEWNAAKKYLEYVETKIKYD